MVDNSELDSTEGNKRAWLLRQIHDVLVSAELERRIDELEECAAQRALTGQTQSANYLKGHSCGI
jgi:hypothetical protein